MPKKTARNGVESDPAPARKKRKDASKVRGKQTTKGYSAAWLSAKLKVVDSLRDRFETALGCVENGMVHDDGKFYMFNGSTMEKLLRAVDSVNVALDYAIHAAEEESPLGPDSTKPNARNNDPAEN